MGRNNWGDGFRDTNAVENSRRPPVVEVDEARGCSVGGDVGGSNQVSSSQGKAMARRAAAGEASEGVATERVVGCDWRVRGAGEDDLC